MKNESVFQFSGDAGSDLIEVLTRAGYSNTRARRAVLLALADATGPVTPAGLLAAARKAHDALGLVTVYRTLEILEAVGLVRKLHLSEGCHSYVLSASAVAAEAGPAHNGSDRHAHHVICRACNRAVEFAGCDIEAVIASVRAQTGFSVQDHWLEMFGLCPSCQEKSS